VTLRPKLEEIARVAGVSKATVDRVLNNRAGVQGHTRAHVLAVANELSGLGSSARANSVALDFVLPGGDNEFIADLASQIEHQMRKRGDVDIRVHRVEGIDPDEIATRLATLRPGCQGVGLVGLDSPSVREAVRKLIASGLPVLTLVSDITHVGRFNYVGIDNRAAGRLAGYLIGRFLPGAAGKVALIAGALAYRGHEEREMGFRHVLRERFPNLSITAEREVQESADRAYSEVKNLLAEHQDLKAIYCIGAGQDGVGRALVESGRENDVVFIGHDLTDHSRAALLSGVMDAVIDQNSIVEGREAVDRLVRAVRQDQDISTATVRIQSVFRENIPSDV